AVAHHRRGHAVPAGTGAGGVPEDLGIHVGVAVDEAGGDHMPVGIDLVAGPLVDPPDEADAAVDDAHIGPVGTETGAVDDGPVPDHDVIGHTTSFAREG